MTPRPEDHCNSNTAGGRAGRQARGRSGARHCTAGQSCYAPLGRHLITFVSWCRALDYAGLPSAFERT